MDRKRAQSERIVAEAQERALVAAIKWRRVGGVPLPVISRSWDTNPYRLGLITFLVGVALGLEIVWVSKPFWRFYLALVVVVPGAVAFVRARRRRSRA